MGRPRKSIKELEASGAFKKDPQRKRNPEPVPTGPIGEPPERMPAEQHYVWYELISEVPPGVLTNADRHHFRLTCGLCWMYDTMGVVEMSSSKIKDMERALGKYGLTPVDRNRINIAPEKKKNPFAGIGGSVKPQA